MTIIAAIENQGKIFLGSDSAASNDNLIDRLDRSKIIKRKNIAIAFCSSFRVGQIIEYNFDFSKIRKSERWLFSKFPELMRKTLEKNGAKCFDDGDKIAGAGEFIIGHCGKIYVMQSDFSILRTDREYAALGSGQHFALGSFHSTANIADARERITLAMEAACEFDPQCTSPLHVVELGA